MKISSALLLLILNVWMLPPARADFQQGLDAARLGEHMQALKVWQPLAAEGHAPSQYNLGLMYLHGLGVPASAERAREWIRKAAAQGYGPAKQKLPSLP
jgi:TPR repeat protein